LGGDRWFISMFSSRLIWYGEGSCARRAGVSRGTPAASPTSKQVASHASHTRGAARANLTRVFAVKGRCPKSQTVRGVLLQSRALTGREDQARAGPAGRAPQACWLGASQAASAICHPARSARSVCQCLACGRPAACAGRRGRAHRHITPCKAPLVGQPLNHCEAWPAAHGGARPPRTAPRVPAGARGNAAGPRACRKP